MIPTARAGVPTPSPGPPRAWRRPEVLAAAIGVIMLAAQVGWLAANQRPVEYDSAWYLENAVTMQRALREDGVGGLLAAVRGAFKTKAPGVSLAGAVAMAVAGETPRSAMAVSLLASVLSAVYLWFLGRRFLSPPGAALAAVLAASMPLAFALGRSFLVEASLTASVVAFLFHAAASSGLRRPLHVVALAGWGAAGLLVKVSFPAYVVLPALVLSLAPRPAGLRPWARWLGTWLAVAAASVALAGWLWYADNWRAVLDYTRSVGSGPLAAQYAVPMSTYLAALVLHAWSPWTVLALTAVVGAAASRRCAGVSWPALALALAWLVPPAVLLASSSARFIRYLAPLLPATALLQAALAEPWLRRSGRAAMFTAALLAGPPLLYFAVATVPSPLADTVRGWVEAPWLGGNVTWYEGPPDRWPWPSAAIVAAAAPPAGDQSPVVLRLNVDISELNHNNLKLEALLQHASVVPAQIDQSSPDGAIATALDGDFLLLQTGGEVANDFVNVQRATVARELATGRQPYREVASFDLPAGRRVTLLARRCVVEGAVVSGAPLATLERGLELLSLEVARPTPGLVSVRTRYRARSGSHPMLAVLVQVAGPDGRVLGGQEHLLCRRPQRPWPAGSVIEDTFLLPAGVAAPGLGLRLGLRDLLTGAPLRVERVGAGIQSVDGVSVAVERLSERVNPPAAP